MSWLPPRENYKDRTDEWDAEMTGIPDSGEVASLDAINANLKDKLERANGAVKVLDDKAALVIPAIGAIAAITGSQISAKVQDNWYLIALGVAAALCAVSAIGFALSCLKPRDHDNGADALVLLQLAHDPDPALKMKIAKSMGFASVTTEYMTLQKAWHLQASMMFGGVGVILLTAFVALGGMAAKGA